MYLNELFRMRLKTLSLVLFVTLTSHGLAQPCSDGACIFAGPRLASVDSQRSVLLSTVFSTLLGGNLSLSVLDWNAIAQGNINLVDFLDALALELGVSSPAEALSTEASLLQVLDAMLVVAQADGNTALVNALGALKSDVAGLTGTLKLGDLLQLAFPPGALSDIELNALDLLTGSVQLYNYRNVLTTPSPITLSGTALGTLGLTGVFNSVELYLQVVEPPIYVCGPTGTSFHTAAVRTKLNVDLVDIAPDTSVLEGLLSVALPGSSVNVSLALTQIQVYAELARAEGTLTAVDNLANTVTVQAVPGVVDVYVGQIDDGLFFNRSHVIDPLADVQLGTIGELSINVDQPLLLPDIDVSTSIEARTAARGQAPSATSLTFNSYPSTQTAYTSADFVTNLVSDLVTNLEVQLGGSLGPTLDLLVDTIILPAVTTLTQTALSPVLSTVLTGLVDPLLELLGVRIGEVDVTVLGSTQFCDITVTGVVFNDLEPNLRRDGSEDWGAGVGVFVNLLDSLGTLSASVEIDPVSNSTGSYSFSNVIPGEYMLIVTDSSTATSSSAPSGWVFTSPPDGQRPVAVTNSDVNDQDFGLFNGHRVSGSVFYDDGFLSGSASPYSLPAAANDAFQNATEQGIAAVEVTATDGTRTRKSVTNGAGIYTIFIPGTWSDPVTLSHAQTVPSGYNDGATAQVANSFNDVGAATVSFNLAANASYNFGVVSSSRLRPDQSAQANSGDTLSYNHLYSPGTLGSVDLQLTNGRYSYQIFRDVNCDGIVEASEQLDVLDVGFTVDADWPRDANGRLASCTLELRLSIPQGEAKGRTDIVTLTADLTWQNSVVHDLSSVTDVTTLTGGSQLTVTKQVRNVTAASSFSVRSEAAPGDRLEYCVSYHNTGAEQLIAAELLDPLPYFTTFAAAAYGGAGQDMVWDDDTATQVLTAAVDGDAGVYSEGVVVVALGNVSPGRQGQVCYQVIVN